MSAQTLTAAFLVLLVGVALCVTPLFTRPTLQFGVRVPPAHTGAEVIGRERRAYMLRTGVLAGCCTVAAALLTSGSPWLVTVLVLLQVAAGFGCFLLARERITAVKTAEGWFEGVRQTVTADTTWRTEPERLPVLWTLPALAVVAATVVTGIARYPGLPDRLPVHFTASGTADRWAGTSVWSAFSLVAGQLFVTAVIVGLLLLTYRSRPDADPTDPASTQRYRRFLAVTARALLALAALVNAGLLLGALQIWQVYRPTGAPAALPVVPVLAGTVALVAVLLRMGQGGHRLAAPGAAPAGGGGGGRDDDRYWKAGVIYVNRDDPAVVVGRRFGIGWTLNFGNPRAWCVFGAIVAVAVGLSVFRR